ncbi:T-cell surface glycoprotein CD8 alpha chain-like [Mixophyes fleayi]|uniref:T-cell surface glycoprotein CD8 alpha chain-like n=1 Tax=Mixophyes fleayi TaxID=3061075 RepID=UPI003F4E0B2C
MRITSSISTGTTAEYHIMATVICPLLFLCLISCSHQLKLQGPSVQTGFSEKVRLKCNPDMGESMDLGVFWLHQKKDSKNLESIVFLSPTKKQKYSDPNLRIRFLPDRTGSAYSLTIKSCGQMDQGTYYCMINNNSVLYISRGFSLFCPQASATEPSTPPISTKSKGTGDECGCSPGKPDLSAEQFEVSDLSCDPYIWTPMTGLCGLLLICLVVTFIILNYYQGKDILSKLNILREAALLTTRNNSSRPPRDLAPASDWTTVERRSARIPTTPH